MKRLGAALTLLFVATAVFAQSAEYGRAGGDEVALPFKKPGNFSGSLDFSSAGGGIGGKSIGATMGGALVADKLWFFGAMQRDDSRRSFANLTLPAAMQPKAPATSFSLKATSLTSSHSFFSATVTSHQSQPAFFTHW